MYSIRATYIPREDMHFDRDYYIKHHIPLAQKQLAGRVRYLQMHAEFDMRVLMEEEDLRSPCVFVLSVQTREDVEAFREFRRSSEVVPLREDIEKYTNCVPEWTVAEVLSEKKTYTEQAREYARARES